MEKLPVLTNRHALIMRGGHTPGQRPRTVLAILQTVSIDSGVACGYTGLIARAGGGHTKPRPIGLGAICARWDHLPTAKQVWAVKQLLPVMSY